MTALLVLLGLLTLVSGAATVRAVLTDGYGSRRDRCDRYASTRPI